MLYENCMKLEYKSTSTEYIEIFMEQETYEYETIFISHVCNGGNMMLLMVTFNFICSSSSLLQAAIHFVALS